MVDRGSRIEVELADQREVVAGDAREFAAAGVQVLAVEGPVEYGHASVIRKALACVALCC